MLTPLLHTAHHSFSCRKLGVAFADRLKARTFGRTVADAVEQHNGTLVLFKVFLTVLAESRCSHRAVHTERQSARRQNRPGAKALHLSTSAHTGSALERGSSSFSRQCQSAWRKVCEPCCRPDNRAGKSGSVTVLLCASCWQVLVGKVTMVLVLAIHSVSTVTAKVLLFNIMYCVLWQCNHSVPGVAAVKRFSQKLTQVPFSMIALIDHIRQRDLPPELKCRQVAIVSCTPCALSVVRALHTCCGTNA